MRKLLFAMCVMMLVAACGHRKPSASELQHKIDSVNALEQIRQLKLQGVQLGESSPLEMFYDSLNLQALPLSYSDNYVSLLPGYTPVPQAIKNFLELEGRSEPKAVALPETLGTRLVLLAADVTDNEYELWLYSLDNEYYPVDKLLLYEPPHLSEKKLGMESQRTYFSITSDLEIRIMEYADENDRQGQLSTFIVDEGRYFVERRPEN